ncbi:unnamed protein product [Ambrosiozyma monospora]|uniref:Unnamed protein product n=1 Tax=Ambrosiozyma monospora TaxID=43982 RepID=A0ACB5SRJ4_AMBMO|nr:unnamed protein product [Ambrosiozyma monospora]
MMDIIEHVSIRNAKILTIQDQDIQPELNQLLLTIKDPFYHFLTQLSQNPSRQRQFVSKSLILWDKLQVEAEAFEVKVNSKYTDVFPESGVPVMPLSSMIYYFKLLSMADYVFKSIELDLYKDLRELHVGYWLLSYILDYVLQHLQRLLDIKRLRISQIANFPKKIKKAKGDKKAKLKIEYEACKSRQGELLKMVEYFEFQHKKLTIYRCLVELYLTAFQILYNLGFMKLPQLCSVSEEMLFNLQLKAFQSIGIPQIPGYQTYHQDQVKADEVFKVLIKEKNFKYFNVVVDGKSEELTALFRSLPGVIDSFKFHENLTESMHSELKSLRRAHVNIKLTIHGLIKSLESGKDQKINADIERLHHHLYFPALKVTTTDKN